MHFMVTGANTFILDGSQSESHMSMQVAKDPPTADCV